MAAGDPAAVSGGPVRVDSADRACSPHRTVPGGAVGSAGHVRTAPCQSPGSDRSGLLAPSPAGCSVNLTERRLARLPQAARPATARPTARAHGPDSGAVVTWSDSNCDTCVPADPQTLPNIYISPRAAAIAVSSTDQPVRGGPQRYPRPPESCGTRRDCSRRGHGTRPSR